MRVGERSHRSDEPTIDEHDALTAPMTPLTSGQSTIAEPASIAPPSGEDTSATHRQRALLEREEGHGERRRVMTALLVGIVGWNMYGVLDAVRYWIGTDPDLVAPLALRLAVSLPAIVLYAYLRMRRDPSRGAVRAIELYTFTSGGAGIGLMALRSGGLESYHLSGVVLVTLGHALLLGSSWRRALLPIVSATLAMPVVLAIAALFDPEIAAQWRSPTALTRFAQDFTFALGGSALALIGGHAVWSLRKEVAEARSIGRYRLKRKIASGGMGEVWTAYHAALKRDVAVKLMQPRLGQDEHAVVRFEREVRALAELTHPYIVRVLDYGATEDGIWYYAMELLEGDDLQSIVEREGALAPVRALRIVRQAAEALAEAHARGIVHRDVKPANLFVVPSEGGEFVKLIDFGIARLGDENELTATGVVIGTPGYLAPEVIMGARATPCSDVYALGAVLYFLLAGRGPLEADTPQAMVMAHLGQDPPRPSERLGRALSPRIEDVVMRCLRKEPAARFADASDLVVALRALERATMNAD